jgi:general secretion pathway protein D
MPIQVMLEASLAEVTLNDDLRFGLQWSAIGGDGVMTLSEAPNGAINQQFPGFSYLFTGRPDIRAVLNSIETLTDVNVLSSPKLLVLNNHEANLQIGDQVPITVQSSVGTINNNAPIVNSVQLRDTGVILRVTPRANKSGLVLLEIAQEVSDVVPTTSSNIDSPTIQQRKVSSSVAVHDGETIALGGLIRNSHTKSRGGIPLLRSIPGIGTLFGSTSNNTRRTELIILITPHVMRSRQDTTAMMDDLRSEFRKIKKVMPGWDKPADKKTEKADDKSGEKEPKAE